jgi:uncharacterized membrane protein YhaH (DUF805 family)
MMAGSPNDRFSPGPQNPYQAPVNPYTQVAKVDYEQNLTWLLFSFKGRLNRARYWAAMIPAAIVYFGLLVALDATTGEESPAKLLILPILFAFAWVSLATQIKRWHDRDKSGWWIFIGIIPIIGGIWQFVEVGCLRGTVGDNTYGPDPLSAY